MSGCTIVKTFTKLQPALVSRRRCGLAAAEQHARSEDRMWRV